MTTSFRFDVPGPPVAQPRQRHRVARGIVMNYTPKTHPVWAFKRAAAEAAAAAMPKKWKTDAAVAVAVTFVVARPQRLAAKKYPGRVWAAVKPDLDNLLKALFDGLNAVIWVDDSLVVDLAAAKVYAAPWEEPHAEVSVRPAGRC